MYYQSSLDDVDTQPIASTRWSKVGVPLIIGVGGACLVLLSIASTSVFPPKLESNSAEGSTNLVGLAPLSRFKQISKRPSPVLPQEHPLLGGPSPWKNLAIAALKANNLDDRMRDVSMRAAVNEEMSKADDKTKKELSQVTEKVVWKAKEMAGITEPMGFFDPVGFASPGTKDGKLLFYREVELKHGRVCMLASLGILVGENYHPLFGGNIDVPAYRAFQETPLQTFWPVVLTAIAIPELFSVFTIQSPGKVDGKDSQWWMMKEGDRVPGDFGFDPLRLKPANQQVFRELQNKELNNGRLAMIAAAGMIAQELVSGEKVLTTAGKVFFAPSAGLAPVPGNR